ncbi:MAG: hypothetical protein ACFFCP_05095 [Promethearchaeota archaeon]
MKSLIVRSKKLIIFMIFGLIFVFFVPLEFAIGIGMTSSGFSVSNVVFSIDTSTGAISYTIFRWILGRHPLSLFLTIAAAVFTLRLHQRSGKSYPIYSASAVSVALWSIPVYYFVQFFSVDAFHWFEIRTNAPIPIGFCSILFLVFVILPSINWYSNSASRISSASAIKKNETLTGEGEVILTPKRGSILAFLVAFLLPGLVLLQISGLFETSLLDVDFLGFLPQFIFFPPFFQQIFYTVQEISQWDTIGLSILYCAPSLIFAWFVMRYVHGKNSKRSTIIVGVISEIPPITYSVFGFMFEYGWIIIPFPAAFIAGILVMHFTHVIEQTRRAELGDSEIAVPLMTRLKSRFGRHRRTPAIEPVAEKVEDKDQENQSTETK